jgi:hypothetical protein
MVVRIQAFQQAFGVVRGDVFHSIDRIWYVMNVAAETEAQSNAKIAGNVRHLIIVGKSILTSLPQHTPKVVGPHQHVTAFSRSIRVRDC